MYIPAYDDEVWAAANKLVFAGSDEERQAVIESGVNPYTLAKIAPAIMGTISMAKQANARDGLAGLEYIVKHADPKMYEATVGQHLKAAGISKEEYIDKFLNPMIDTFGVRRLEEMEKPGKLDARTQKTKIWKAVTGFLAFGPKLIASGEGMIERAMAGAGVNKKILRKVMRGRPLPDEVADANVDKILAQAQKVSPAMSFDFIHPLVNGSHQVAEWLQDKQRVADKAYEYNIRQKETTINALRTLTDKASREGGLDGEGMRLYNKLLLQWDTIKDLPEAKKLSETFGEMGLSAVEELPMFVVAEGAAARATKVFGGPVLDLIEKAAQTGRTKPFLEAAVKAGRILTGVEAGGMETAMTAKHMDYVYKSMNRARMARAAKKIDNMLTHATRTAGMSTTRGGAVGSFWSLMEYGADSHEEKTLAEHWMDSAPAFMLLDGIGGTIFRTLSEKIKSGKIYEGLAETLLTHRAALKGEAAMKMAAGEFKTVADMHKWETGEIKKVVQKFLKAKRVKGRATKEMAEIVKSREYMDAAKEVEDIMSGDEFARLREAEYQLISDPYGFQLPNQTRLLRGSDEVDFDRPIIIDTLNMVTGEVEDGMKSVADILGDPAVGLAGAEHYANGIIVGYAPKWETGETIARVRAALKDRGIKVQFASEGRKSLRKLRFGQGIYDQAEKYNAYLGVIAKNLKQDVWKLTSGSSQLTRKAYEELSPRGKEMLFRVLNEETLDIANEGDLKAIIEIHKNLRDLVHPEYSGGLEFRPEVMEQINAQKESVDTLFKEILEKFDQESLKKYGIKDLYERFQKINAKTNVFDDHYDDLGEIIKDQYELIIKALENGKGWHFDKDLSAAAMDISDIRGMGKIFFPLMETAKAQGNAPVIAFFRLTSMLHDLGETWRTEMIKTLTEKVGGGALKVTQPDNRILLEAARNPEVFRQIIEGSKKVGWTERVGGVVTRVEREIENPEDVRHALTFWDYVRQKRARGKEGWSPDTYLPSGYRTPYLIGEVTVDTAEGKTTKRFKHNEVIESINEKGDVVAWTAPRQGPTARSKGDAIKLAQDIYYNEVTAADKGIKKRLDQAIRKYGRDIVLNRHIHIASGTSSRPLHLGRRFGRKISKFKEEFRDVERALRARNYSGKNTVRRITIHEAANWREAKYKPKINGKVIQIEMAQSIKQLRVSVKKLREAGTITKEEAKEIIKEGRERIAEKIWDEVEIQQEGKTIRFLKQKRYNLPVPEDAQFVDIVQQYLTDSMNEIFINPMWDVYRSATGGKWKDHFARWGKNELFEKYLRNVGGEISKTDKWVRDTINAAYTIIRGKEGGIASMAPVSKAMQKLGAIQAVVKLGGVSKGVMNATQIHLLASRIGWAKTMKYVREGLRDPAIMRNIEKMFGISAEVGEKMRTGEALGQAKPVGAAADVMRSSLDKTAEILGGDPSRSAEKLVNMVVGTGTFNKTESALRRISVYAQAREYDAMRGLTEKDPGSMISKIMHGEMSLHERALMSTWNIMDNFIYDKTNAPIFMWGPLGRGAGLFRTYALNYLARSIDMFRYMGRAGVALTQGQKLTDLERKNLMQSARWMTFLQLSGGLKAVPLAGSIGAIYHLTRHDGKLWNVINYGMPTLLGLQTSSTQELNLLPESPIHGARIEPDKVPDFLAYLMGGVNVVSLVNALKVYSKGDVGVFGQRAMARYALTEWPIMKRLRDAVIGQYQQPLSPMYRPLDMSTIERVYSALGFNPFAKHKYNEIMNEYYLAQKDRQYQQKLIKQKLARMMSKKNFDKFEAARIYEEAIKDGVITDERQLQQYIKLITDPAWLRNSAGGTLVSESHRLMRIAEELDGYIEDDGVKQIIRKMNEAREAGDRTELTRLSKLMQHKLFGKNKLARLMLYNHAEVMWELSQSKDLTEKLRSRLAREAKKIKDKLRKSKKYPFG